MEFSGKVQPIDIIYGVSLSYENISTLQLVTKVKVNDDIRLRYTSLAISTTNIANNGYSEIIVVCLSSIVILIFKSLVVSSCYEAKPNQVTKRRIKENGRTQRCATMDIIK